MGHLLQAECWERHPWECSFGCLWLRELAKVMTKALEGKMSFLAQLFMKIMKIRRKKRWQVTCCMWGGKWRKIMENEENIGLIHKNAYEDQLVTFCQFSFGALSLFSLSYSWTLRVFLDNFGIGERKVKKARGIKYQTTTIGFIAGINLHVHFPC